MNETARSTVRLAVQSSNRLIRDALVAYLAARPGHVMVGYTSSVEDLGRLCLLRRPDVLVVETVTLSAEAIEALRVLRTGFPTIEVVVVYTELSPAALHAAIRAGLTDLVPAAHGLDGLLRALRQRPHPINRTTPDGLALTDRELEIVLLLASGHSVPEMAALLDISPHTVDNHKRHLYAKLGVGSQAHAVARAVSLGLTPQARTARIAGSIAAERGRDPLVVLAGARGDGLDEVARTLVAAGLTVAYSHRSHGPGGGYASAPPSLPSGSSATAGPPPAAAHATSAGPTTSAATASHVNGSNIGGGSANGTGANGTSANGTGPNGANGVGVAAAGTNGSVVRANGGGHSSTPVGDLDDAEPVEGVEAGGATQHSFGRDHWYGWHRGPLIAVLVDPSDADWLHTTALNCPVVVVHTRAPALPAMVDALLRGAHAILRRDQVRTDLAAIVSLVRRGYVTLSAEHLADLTDCLANGMQGNGAGLPDLTARERDILNSIAGGHTVRQTARALGIAAKTVENTQARLFRKLGVHNRSGAVHAAYQLGLVDQAVVRPQRGVANPG